MAFLALACGTAVIVATLYSQGSADLPQQDAQPLDFSHELHAGRLQVACLFCHRHAEVSPVAGIPSMQVCMSCHQSMSSHSPGAQRLQQYWDDGRPVPWVRLQRLPDFVYFTHEMHLAAGLQCANCHGNVEAVSETPRAATYEMGWCLTCHRQREAPQDCWTCHK
jgi:hypothetical protein